MRVIEIGLFQKKTFSFTFYHNIYNFTNNNLNSGEGGDPAILFQSYITDSNLSWVFI